MSEMIYLEVDRSNGAILSFDYEKLKSSTSDFIEATEAELNYLNHLENNVFPAGMVATLGDLTAYRTKMKAVALAKFNVAQAQGRLAKAVQARAALKASMDAMMIQAAADRNMTVPELQSALADFKARNESPADPVYQSGKTRSETAKILQRMHRDSKRGYSK